MRKWLTIFILISVGFACGASPAPVHYYGSKKSTIYHRENCRSVKRISPPNLIIFASKDEARLKGYRPCKVCKP